MENKNLSTFVSDQFGSVRTLTIDGEPWFVAADVCRALDISNPRDAVKRLEDDERMTVDLTDGHSKQRGGAQKLNAINEPGLYSLVLASRKPEAKAFKRWITHEVIPTIRKTGAYAVPGTPMMTAEQAAVLLESMHAFMQNQSEFLVCASKVLDAMNAFTDVSQKLVQAVIDTNMCIQSGTGWRLRMRPNRMQPTTRRLSRKKTFIKNCVKQRRRNSTTGVTLQH